MTAALALLLIGIALIALGRRHRTEQAAPHLVGAGFICLLFALLVFAVTPAAGAEQPGPPPREERFVLIRASLMQEIAAHVNAQAIMVRDLQQQNARAALMLQQQGSRIAALCELVRATPPPEGCR